jgi:hypothetical protein
MAHPAGPGDPRYRTIDEATTVQHLLARGWPFEMRGGGAEAALAAARATLAQCVAEGLPHGLSKTGARLFDPAEVTNFLDLSAFRDGDRAWDRHRITGRRLIAEALAGGDTAGGPPPPPPTLGAARFAVTLRRTFNLADQPRGRVRLRLPLPIEDETLEDVATVFEPPPGVAARATAGPARLDIAIADAQGAPLTVGVRLAFTARPWRPAAPAAALGAEERALHTRPREGLIRVTNRISELAERLAGGATDPHILTRRFWTFLLGDLMVGTVHYDQLPDGRPLDWVLEQGWYDCNLGSALFVGLCRARGLPARMVTGYMLHVTAPFFHTWSEVWFDDQGWTPFDVWTSSLETRDTGAGWRDYFFGALDARLTTQRLPRLFNGTGQVRLPPAWRMLTSLEGAGLAVTFSELATGALIYREYIEVERLG